MTSKSPQLSMSAVLLTALVASLSACSNSNNDSPSQTALIPYEIIKREEIPINKILYHIRLDFIDGDRLPSVDELTAVSSHLKESNPGFDSFWARFWIRGYDTREHPPFAVADDKSKNGEMTAKIYKRPIPQSAEKENYGLAESKRKLLYYDLSEHELGYDEWDNDERLETERLLILTRYGLPKEIDYVWKIYEEGFEKGWASPNL